MADRIEKNDGEPFGGAVLIFPPGEAATVVEILNLDPTPDAAIFWATIRTKADEAASNLQSQARQHQAGFRR